MGNQESIKAKEKDFLSNFEENLIVDDSCIKNKKPVADGNFGTIYKAQLKTKNSYFDVAVKTMKHELRRKSQADLVRNDDVRITLFKKEGLNMRKLKHKNIVDLKGISYIEESFAIILEWMDNGDLLSYVRKHNLTANQKMTILNDVSSGMEYLSSKLIFHRDLAARNVLLDKNLNAKIGDFGLSVNSEGRQHYISRSKSMGQRVPAPIWWMSPECIAKRHYDEKTDVWSFAILMWEVISNGATPYSNYKWQGERTFVRDLKKGLRPEKVPKCPLGLWRTVELCWNVSQCHRPHFSELHTSFRKTLPVK